MTVNTSSGVIAGPQAIAWLNGLNMKNIENQIVPADSVDYAKADNAVASAAKGVKASKAMMQTLSIPQVRGYLHAELDLAGATLAKTAQVIAEAHAATEEHYFAYNGQVVDERSTPDHSIRLKAAELNLKARGELVDKEGINIFMQMSDEQLAGIASGQIDPGALIDLGPRVNELRDGPA